MVIMAVVVVSPTEEMVWLSYLRRWEIVVVAPVLVVVVEPEIRIEMGIGNWDVVVVVVVVPVLVVEPESNQMDLMTLTK